MTSGAHDSAAGGDAHREVDLEKWQALCLGSFGHVDETTAVFAYGKHYSAIDKCIEGMILAHAYIEAGVMHCAALTFENVASLSKLTAENLHTESFAF